MKLTLDILVLMMISKKKQVLAGLNGSFQKNFVGRGQSFLNKTKELKKSLKLKPHENMLEKLCFFKKSLKLFVDIYHFKGKLIFFKQLFLSNCQSIHVFEDKNNKCVEYKVVTHRNRDTVNIYTYSEADCTQNFGIPVKFCTMCRNSNYSINKKFYCLFCCLR